MGETILLKVSRQGQVTLRREVRVALGNPTWLECWMEDRTLKLRPAICATLEEAETMFGRQGITRDVLVEALKIVKARGGRKSSG